MEKYTMFMNQKNQYSENEYIAQSNLYSIPIKLPMVFFTELKQFHNLCGEGNVTPLQYSYLESPMHGGAW